MQHFFNGLAPMSIISEISLDHDNNPRKKRAVKACIACRERKVRCDVSRTGLPCTNCVANHRNCLTKERIRRRRADRHVEIQSYPLHWNGPLAASPTELSLFEGSSPLFNALSPQSLGSIPNAEKPDAVRKSTSDDLASPMSALLDIDLHHLMQNVDTDFNNDSLKLTASDIRTSLGKVTS
jgi:hypothetical protein